jgi:hypothetical protein
MLNAEASGTYTAQERYGDTVWGPDMMGSGCIACWRHMAFTTMSSIQAYTAVAWGVGVSHEMMNSRAADSLDQFKQRERAVCQQCLNGHDAETRARRDQCL